MIRKILLACGVLSSVLYLAITVFVAMQWEILSFAAQTISEPSAIGVQRRSLWVLAAAFYTVLVTAFGWGIWKSAGNIRALHIVGWLMVAYGALCLIWPFEALALDRSTLSDTLHILLASVTIVLMLLAISFGAVAFGKRFRVYSFASLAILVAFGALTFLDAPRVAANLPLASIRVWERIDLAVFLPWVVVLAIRLMRVPNAALVTSRPGALAGAGGSNVIEPAVT